MIRQQMGMDAYLRLSMSRLRTVPARPSSAGIVAALHRLAEQLNVVFSALQLDALGNHRARNFQHWSYCRLLSTWTTKA